MKLVTVSAPGKLHVSGEHAVVYGNPALIVATSLRLYSTLERNGDAPTIGTLRENDPYIAAILEVFSAAYDQPVEDSLHLAVQSAIPVGAGMGSSAALAVSLIGALTTWYQKPWSIQKINELANKAEKQKHGNSSGSDPAIAANGGILWYRKELEFLKTMWLLSMRVPKSFPSLQLINTGRVESTGDLVGMVAQKKQQNESLFAKLLTDIETETKAITQAIHDENEAAFREGIKQNEVLLEKMGVVSTKTKVLIRRIEKIGGVAKISGAGGIKDGSGVVIAVGDAEQIRSIAGRSSYGVFQTVLGGAGVKLERAVA